MWKRKPASPGFIMVPKKLLDMEDGAILLYLRLDRITRESPNKCFQEGDIFYDDRPHLKQLVEAGLVTWTGTL